MLLDIWSFGLLLVEMVIGRYLILSLEENFKNISLLYLMRIFFGVRFLSGVNNDVRLMVIFEFLDYIVNEV